MIDLRPLFPEHYDCPDCSGYGHIPDEDESGYATVCERCNPEEGGERIYDPWLAAIPF